MRDPPIWESAGRPLFVRCVWLAVAGRRGFERHFILDYDEWPLKKKQHQKLMMKYSSPRSVDKKNNSSPSESSDFDDGIESPKELHLLGSPKHKYQLSQIPHSKEQQHRTTTSTYNQHHHQCNNHEERNSFLPSPSKRPSESRNFETFPEILSRRSSLQDLQSTLSNAASTSNPDERLAERVLNWLDLASKTSALPHADEASNFGEATNPEDVTQKTWQSCQQPMAPSQPILTELKSQQQQQLNATRKQSCLVARSTRRSLDQVTKQQQQNNRHQHQNPHQRNYQHHYQHQRPESMKHISIIFNKERAVPVRLNRSSAHRIDLATLVANVGRSVRRPVTTSRYDNHNKRPGTISTSASAMIAATVAEAKASAKKKHDCLGDILSNHSTKYLLEDTVNSSQDSKQQLHVFIPNLVKGSLLSSSGGEDVASLVSNSLSENFSSLLN